MLRKNKLCAANIKQIYREIIFMLSNKENYGINILYGDLVSVYFSIYAACRNRPSKPYLNWAHNAPCNRNRTRGKGAFRIASGNISWALALKWAHFSLRNILIIWFYLKNLVIKNDKLNKKYFIFSFFYNNLCVIIRIIFKLENSKILFKNDHKDKNTLSKERECKFWN